MKILDPVEWEMDHRPKLKLRIHPRLEVIGDYQPPKLINLKGRKNTLGPSLKKAPSNLIYIGRQMYMGGWKLPKSKWFNPYSAKKYGREMAIQHYYNHIISTSNLVDSLPELNGKILACWCSPESCHGEILIRLFNSYVDRK